jgi:hypothetical protein
MGYRSSITDGPGEYTLVLMANPTHKAGKKLTDGNVKTD